jgi:hypothetical protein
MEQDAQDFRRVESGCAFFGRAMILFMINTECRYALGGLEPPKYL